MPRKERSAEVSEWQNVHLTNYSGSVANYRSWFAAADELQFSAELLKPQVTGWWAGLAEWKEAKERPRQFPALGCHSIAMMLFAYVVENLCKGALIRDGRVNVSRGTVAAAGLPKELKTHNLRKLVRAIGMENSDLDQELLARMTRAAVWRGRYPAPVKYDETIHTLRLDNGNKHSAAWFGANDLERIESLVARIRGHLRADRSFTVARDAAP